MRGLLARARRHRLPHRLLRGPRVASIRRLHALARTCRRDIGHVHVRLRRAIHAAIDLIAACPRRGLGVARDAGSVLARALARGAGGVARCVRRSARVAVAVLGAATRRIRAVAGNTAAGAAGLATRIDLPGRLARTLAWWRGAIPRLLHAGDRDFVCEFAARAYPGSRHRRYVVHLPPNHDGHVSLPLVMVLHGCRQRDDDIRRITDFDAVADREGFIVVYPFVTSYSGFRTRNCWGWWSPKEIHAGRGEVEDLWQIIEEVKARHAVDERRIHVTGLSSGAGMAVAMMVAHAGRIASGAPVAGVPYHESPRAVSFGKVHQGRFKPVALIGAAMAASMGDARRPVPILIVHSDGDATVDIQAAHNLRDSWAQCFRIGLDRISEKAGTTRGTPWRHTRYRDSGRRSVIETLLLSGRGHGWYGGNAGEYSYPDAPDVSRLIWRFFREHPLEHPVAATARAQHPDLLLAEAWAAGG